MVALAATLTFEIRVGERLPELRGEFLTGKEAVLPEAAEGRVALLLLGFTYKSRFPVEEWAEKFRRRFQSDSGVTFYETPMMGGAARLGKWFIDSGMRRGTPKEAHEHVITVYRDAGVWRQRVALKNEETACLILLDQRGDVAWRYEGAFDDTAFLQLTLKVSQLLREK
jgi:hypothetical protein